MQMNQFKRSAIGMALVAAAMMGGTAQASTVTLDVSGIASNGLPGDVSNETRVISLFEGAHITGLAWNVNLSTLGDSFLSEIGVKVDSVNLYPAFDAFQTGSGDFSGSGDLVALGLDFLVGASGQLNFVFFEDFDDNIGADAFWNRGTLTVTYDVPEPATYGLAALGLLGVAFTSRRKKS